jgi:hypothetical protein
VAHPSAVSDSRRPGRGVADAGCPGAEHDDLILPADEELWGLVPETDSDLSGEDAWLSAAKMDALGAEPRERGEGTGFGADGLADRLAPGMVLAGFAEDLWRDGLDRATDDELIGVLRAWRRLSSWAAAGELAAVTELCRRREAEVAAGADPHLAEHVGDELAAALTLTTRAAGNLQDFAAGLARLPLTQAALTLGDIDRVKALVIADETACLNDAHAAAVESAVIDRAPHQTTGQLRAATRHAALSVDPRAAAKRREQASNDARVEVWNERSGTAALAGRDLPPADVLAADKRIDALARQLRTAGAEGTLDQLRALVYTTLLLGHPVESLLPASAGPTGAAAESAGVSGEPAGAAKDEPAGPPLPELNGILAGSLNLTMPLTTWFGMDEEPGEVAGGYGPLPARDARTLADLLMRQPKPRWCLTIIGPDGRPIAHGCGSSRRHPGTSQPAGDLPESDLSGAGRALTITVRPLADCECAHERESPGYRPPPGLRHLISVRQRTCGFPGCRHPATRCDQDHTIPYERGGRTCECNMAALCRRHHRAKQAQGWRLEQPEPGVLAWRLPSGRTYLVEPDHYPGQHPRAG